MEGEREKVLVLGANGKVGKHLVKYLIKNYHVIALIRDAPKYGINSPYLEYATGDAFDSNTLNPLLKSVKIVASCLKPETPHTLLDYVKTLTTSIKENGNPRLIFIGSLGSLKNQEGQFIYSQNNFPNQLKSSAQEHTEVLNQLKNSGIQYTVVCPPVIQNGMDDQDAVIAIDQVKGEVKGSVKGGNVGNFVLQEAKNPTHIGKIVGIWDK